MDKKNENNGLKVEQVQFNHFTHATDGGSTGIKTLAFWIQSN